MRVKDMMKNGTMSKASAFIRALNPSENNHTPSRQQRRAHGKDVNAETDKKMDILYKACSLLPMSVQATISSSDLSIWFTLRDANLVIPVTDLQLQHGVTITGDWTFVGILDAVPDLAPLGENPSEFKGGTFSSIHARFNSTMRQHLGRPNNSFGATPLLIYRQVSM